MLRGPTGLYPPDLFSNASMKKYNATPSDSGRRGHQRWPIRFWGMVGTVGSPPLCCV